MKNAIVGLSTLLLAAACIGIDAPDPDEKPRANFAYHVAAWGVWSEQITLYVESVSYRVVSARQRGLVDHAAERQAPLVEELANIQAVTQSEIDTIEVALLTGTASSARLELAARMLERTITEVQLRLPQLYAEEAAAQTAALEGLR